MHLGVVVIAAAAVVVVVAAAAVVVVVVVTLHDLAGLHEHVFIRLSNRPSVRCHLIVS